MPRNLPAKPPKPQKPAHRTAESATPAWAAWVDELETWKGYPICGRKSRQKSPCTNPPLHGKTCCKLHGGKSLSGDKHPSYKHGRHVGERRARAARLAGSLPANMEKAFAKILDHPDLISQNEFIAAGTYRVKELYETLRDKEATIDQWRAIQATISEFRKEEAAHAAALASPRGKKKDEASVPPPDPTSALNNVEAIVASWHHTQQTHDAINSQMQLVRLHSETEIKRLKEMTNAMSRDAAVLFAASMRSVLVQELDQDTWERVQPKLLEIWRNHLGHLMAAQG